MSFFVKITHHEGNIVAKFFPFSPAEKLYIGNCLILCYAQLQCTTRNALRLRTNRPLPTTLCSKGICIVALTSTLWPLPLTMNLNRCPWLIQERSNWTDIKSLAFIVMTLTCDLGTQTSPRYCSDLLPYQNKAKR